jgi:hypothetical protein
MTEPMMKRVPVAFLLLLLGRGSLSAQDVSTDPLQCWWRTTAGAVRVGEPFSVVLTCAVLETDAATVVVDQSRLEHTVVQFPPFEVLSGSHGADLRTDQRRFFQYEYRLRLISETMFGKDAALPETKISYRVQSKVGQKTAIQGRDQTYLLPSQSIRVMSLVPADASDIRDTSVETFGDIDQRAFRANLFTVIGSVLFVVAGLLALLALVRLFRRYRTPAAAAEQLITDGAVLRGVGRELAAVRRERDSGGWTPDLAGRALAALRIAATYALGRRVGHSVVSHKSKVVSPQSSAFTRGGQLVLRTGWPKGKDIAVSGAVTSQIVTREVARGATDAKRGPMFESLAQALRAFTIAQYGRADAKVDDATLDSALDTAFQVLKRVRLEQTWIMKRLAARRGGAVMPAETRAWSR